MTATTQAPPGSIIEHCKQSYTPQTVCEHLLPDGHREGNEWVAANPTRADFHPGSFSVNLVTGIFTDFATGDKKDRGGDVVALWAYVRGCNMVAAAQQMDKELSGQATPGAIPAVHDRPVVSTAIWPLPDDAPRHKAGIEHPRLGRPADPPYRYLTTEGKLIGYSCRFEFVDDKGNPDKTQRPYFLLRNADGMLKWGWGGPKGNEPRPLYRLHRLGDAKTVVLCEGERTADRGEQLFPPTTAVLSWLGGSSTAPWADLEPLQGRTVVLFPDHDALLKKDSSQLLPYDEQPGVKAMHTIGARLLGLGCKVFMVDYTPGMQKHGWDFADAVAEGWTPQRMLEYVQRNKRDFSKPAVKKTSKNDDDNALWASKKPYSLIFPNELPFVNSKDKPLDMWHNVERMCTIYGISQRYNLMRKEAEVTFPDGPHPAASDEFVSLANVNGIPTKSLDRHLNVICRNNAYHPAVAWINTRPWDGTTRIDAFVQTIQTRINPAMLKQVILRWMVSAIALIFRERQGPRGSPVSARGVLTFAGPQGCGKTQWVLSLAPEGLVQTGVTLQVGNKDSIISAVNSWIVELGEVGATFRKSDIDGIKAFVTQAQDTIRMPYGRTFEAMPRMTVYASTVNDERFLADSTGNSRWWVIPVTKIHYDHDFDMQQVWAEVLHYYRQGEGWHLNVEENSWLINNNEHFEMQDAVAEILDTGLQWGLDNKMQWMWRTASDILRVMGHRPSNHDAKMASKYLRLRNVEEKKFGNNSRFFVPPPRG